MENKEVKAEKKVLKDEMTSKDYSRLIDASINELENWLNYETNK